MSLARARMPTQVERPPGLVYRPELLSEEEERELLAFLETLEFDRISMHGQVAKRTVRHFGREYGYESWKLTPAPEMPAELASLRARGAKLASIAPGELAQALVSRYPPGAGIGWHRDAPMFGDAVIGVSLGGPSRMRFQRRTEDLRLTYELPLEPRSAYVLSGPVRWSWQHSIPATRELRYSVTFRTLRPERGS